MIKIEKVTTYGWEEAIRGARNPMNSWDRMDSQFEANGDFMMGQNDYGLLSKLAKAGSDHRKYMRMVIVYVDITAPLYWWKEFDTYKVGTVANSCSTMHKIHDKEFVMDDFSREHLDQYCTAHLQFTVDVLNRCRDFYLATKYKQYWQCMIQMLPSSYNQKRTVMLNYEVLCNMYYARKNHKLTEWREFCDWVETLPFFVLIESGGRKDE